MSRCVAFRWDQGCLTSLAVPKEPDPAPGEHEHRGARPVAEWDSFHAWLRWTNHLRGADTEQDEQTALTALAQLPQTTSYAALMAGTALGKSVLQRRWYAAQAARRSATRSVLVRPCPIRRERCRPASSRRTSSHEPRRSDLSRLSRAYSIWPRTLATACTPVQPNIVLAIL
jgi:hypothetical protein